MFHRAFQQIGREEFILRQEDALIRSEGPTLGGFVQSPDSSGVFTEQPSPDGKSCSIKIKNDNNANIRLFYYSLLCVCFEKDCHKEGQQYSKNILLNLKMQMYSENLRFDQFNIEEIEQPYRQIYKDATMKKILVEFLQLMNYSDYSVLEMLRRYPIIDLIMVIAIRSILFSTSLRYTKVPTLLLAQFLNVVIGLKIVKGTNGYNISGTRISIMEQDNFSFVLKQQPFLKARRSSLLNNYSISDNIANDYTEDQFEITTTKMSKHEKPHRLTGLEYQEINAKKNANPQLRFLNQRVKQLSLDPMSVDLDHILVIPKHPALNIGLNKDKDILVIAKKQDDVDDFMSKNQTSSGINSRVSRPYHQETRLTEDPRQYISKNGSTHGPLLNTRSTQQIQMTGSITADRYLNKPEYPIAQDITSKIQTPFSSPPLSSGKSQKTFGIEGSPTKQTFRNVFGEATSTPKPIKIHFPKSKQYYPHNAMKPTDNPLESRPC